LAVKQSAVLKEKNLKIKGTLPIARCLAESGAKVRVFGVEKSFR